MCEEREEINFAVQWQSGFFFAFGHFVLLCCGYHVEIPIPYIQDITLALANHHIGTTTILNEIHVRLYVSLCSSGTAVTICK